MHKIIQISNRLINPVVSGIDSEYYEKSWQSLSGFGYIRPEHFWELPQWATRVSAILKASKKQSEFVVVDKPVRFQTGSVVYASVLDANKKHIQNLINLNPDCRFVLGGYTKKGLHGNFTFYDSLRDMVESEAMEWTEDYDYSIFNGESCIPRLTMSTGCSHHCKFCSIEKTIVEVSAAEIYQQVDQFLNNLSFKLIYINDKTFGQASNHEMLEDLYGIVKDRNPQFIGFIVQTTAKYAMKLDFTRLGVAVCEIGIESYNDDILKSLRKPHNTKMIDKAVTNIRNHGIRFLPNIVIGLVGETKETYKRTIEFLKQDILMANVYNLAIYEGTELEGEVNASEKDSNEMEIEKSFYSEEQNRLNKWANDRIFNLLIKSYEKSYSY